ncbi:MAG: hypothetical protein WDO13_18880 [Verrucomicrobiota bacterium]
MLSSFFKPGEYLTFVAALLASIYLGGIGLVVWGGLYWTKGTTAGAYASMGIGAVLGIIFNVVQEFWVPVSHLVTGWAGPASALGRFLAAHPDQSPVTGQALAALTAAICGTAYVTVSLLTCRQNFNLEAMLHRGPYRIASEDPEPGVPEGRSWISRVLDMDEHFTRRDKAVTIATVAYTLFWKLASVALVLWTVLVGRLSPDWWFGYSMVTGVWLTLILGVIVTTWFLFGVTRDLRELVVALRRARRNDADDGTVRRHHNVGEPAPSRLEV